MLASWCSIPLNTCSLSDQWQKQPEWPKKHCAKQGSTECWEEQARKSEDCCQTWTCAALSSLCPKGPPGRRGRADGGRPTALALWAFSAGLEVASLGAPSPLAAAGPGGALDGCQKKPLPGNAGSVQPSTLFRLTEDGFQQMSSEFSF